MTEQANHTENHKEAAAQDVPRRSSVDVAAEDVSSRSEADVETGEAAHRGQAHAAAQNASRRSSVDAAALTVGGDSSMARKAQQTGVSSLSSRTRGGIITLAVVSLLLVCVGAFALYGGFATPSDDPAQGSAQQEQASEQGHATVGKAQADQQHAAQSDGQNPEEADQQQPGDGSSVTIEGHTSWSATADNGGASADAGAQGGGSAGAAAQSDGFPSASSSEQQQESQVQQPTQSNVISVSVSVDSSAVGNLVSAGGTFSFNPGATPYDALCALGLSVNARSTAYGTYVTAIGGLAEKEHGGMSGWMYSVNGSTPMTACSNYVLSDGDNVIWYYVTG